MKDEIIRLQALMKSEGIHIYFVPTSDFHGSEYVGEYFQGRKYLSGFTGSAGSLIITQNQAFLWTDGRYFTQAEQELNGSHIQLMKSGEADVPTVEEWLFNNIDTNMTFAFDGRCVSSEQGDKFSEIVTSKEARLIHNIDLVNQIWHNRPPMSKEKVWKLDLKYCGLSTPDKLKKIREEYIKEDLHNDNNCSLLLCSLDDIAWTLNLRGNDISYCPLFLSYLIINQERGILYADKDKFTDELLTYLEENCIELKPYLSIYEDINKLNGNLYTDYSTTNFTLLELAKNSANLAPINLSSPVSLLKAIKNHIECDNMRNAHIKDGVALVRFMKWLKENIVLNNLNTKEASNNNNNNTINNSQLEIGRKEFPLTEISVAKKLEEFRQKMEGYIEPSFEPIMGYQKHGAIIHYSASPESDATLDNKGFLLSDTGAHYMEGTTDVTRTFVLGPITEEMKYHYTLVLKGHLNLLSAVFKEGCSGLNLDYIARKPIWEAGLEYNHGTGHGVGYLLNVHEGPQAIRHKTTPGRNESTAFKPGMITSNEPGLYFPDKYGIRLENLILCVEKFRNEYGIFLGFAPLTLCPFEVDAINVSQLSCEELNTLNNYHHLVYENLKPYLSPEDKIWLKCVTAPLKA